MLKWHKRCRIWHYMLLVMQIVKKKQKQYWNKCNKHKLKAQLKYNNLLTKWINSKLPNQHQPKNQLTKIIIYKPNRPPKKTRLIPRRQKHQKFRSKNKKLQLLNNKFSKSRKYNKIKLNNNNHNLKLYLKNLLNQNNPVNQNKNQHHKPQKRNKLSHHKELFPSRE